MATSPSSLGRSAQVTVSASDALPGARPALPLDIVYLWDRRLPTDGTDAEQVFSTLAALSRRGHRIELRIPSPWESESRLSAQALQAHYQVEGDFSISYFGPPTPSSVLLRKSVAALSASEVRASLRPGQCLYTRNLWLALPALLSGCAVAYDTHRAWPSQQPLLRPLLRRALSRPNLLGVLCHSEFARRSYETLGVSSDRLTVARNGFDPSRIAGAPNKTEARLKLGLPQDRPIAVYTGHLTPLKGSEALVALAKRTPEVLHLLVGSDAPWLRTLTRGLANVQLVPWQPFDRVADYLSAADVLLLPASNIPLKVAGHTVLPLKLYSYLAAGRPVLAPSTPDVAELIDDGVNGVLVPPGQAEVAAHALRQVISQPELAQKLGRAARERAEGLTWDARAGHIEAFLRRRLGA